MENEFMSRFVLNSNIITRPRIWLFSVLLAFTAYAPTFKLGFLWDDHVMIESNPGLRTWSAGNLKQDFTSDAFRGRGDPYYRPLQVIFNRIDYTIWGLRPFGYHLTNFLFHAGNSILVAELALLLSLGPLTALLVGCLFAVHPIAVEQLMIIAGRAELMGLFFTLLSLLFVVKKGPLGLLVGSAAYVLGLFSKESVIATPFLFLLLLWCCRDKRVFFPRFWIYLILTAPYLVIRQLAVGSPIPKITPVLFGRFYVQAFPKVMAIYTRLILIPWNLHSHRMIPHLSPFWVAYLIAFVGLGAWLLYGRKRLGLFCFGWFVLTLLPKTTIMMTGNFILDHWAYPAAVGVILPLARGFVWLWDHRLNRWSEALAMAVFPLLIGWALLVHLNVALRGSDEKMYRWALHFTDSYPVKYNLGVLLLQTGRAKEAIHYLGDFQASYPENPEGSLVLARAYWDSGHREVAKAMLRALVRRQPDYQPAIRALQIIAQK
jgi:hypothetical protein